MYVHVYIYMYVYIYIYVLPQLQFAACILTCITIIIMHSKLMSEGMGRNYVLCIVYVLYIYVYIIYLC